MHATEPTVLFAQVKQLKDLPQQGVEEVNLSEENHQALQP